MILRDRCSTSYDLASLFRGRRITSEIAAEICESYCNCEVEDISDMSDCRKSRRKASLSILQLPNLKEASQKSFLFECSALKLFVECRANKIDFSAFNFHTGRKSRKKVSFSDRQIDIDR